MVIVSGHLIVAAADRDGYHDLREVVGRPGPRWAAWTSRCPPTWSIRPGSTSSSAGRAEAAVEAFRAPASTRSKGPR